MALLGPGAPGFDGVMELADDQRSYARLLRRLIQEPEVRRDLGLRTRDRILSLHTGRNWLKAVHDAFMKRLNGSGSEAVCRVQTKGSRAPPSIWR